MVVYSHVWSSVGQGLEGALANHGAAGNSALNISCLPALNYKTAWRALYVGVVAVLYKIVSFAMVSRVCWQFMELF